MKIKRTVLVFLISFLLIFSATAKSQESEFNDRFKNAWSGHDGLFRGLTREIPISGDVTTIGNINITIIDETEDGNIGVPFNIESESFTTHPAGHKIGDFTLFSNSSKATIYITVEPLKPIWDESVYSLDYSLVFGYSFDVFDENGKFSGTKVEEKSVQSGIDGNIIIDAGNEHQQLNCSGDIRVRLNGDLSKVEQAPVGAYESTIIISMVAE